jgi:hypothetical protein
VTDDSIGVASDVMKVIAVMNVAMRVIVLNKNT